MTLWKNGTFVDDGWETIADGAEIPADRPVLVSLARYLAERDALAARNAPLGLVIPPGSDVAPVTAELARFPVIAVTVPKYGDGRAFSIARLLRRAGYAGEIRAVGVFIVDQMPLMRRVGIDAFVVPDETSRRVLERGVWPEVPYYLQPVDDTREVPAGSRPWLREPADGAMG